MTSAELTGLVAHQRKDHSSVRPFHNHSNPLFPLPRHRQLRPPVRPAPAIPPPIAHTPPCAKHLGVGVGGCCAINSANGSEKGSLTPFNFFSFSCF